jgi:hypothetical protein
MIEKLTLTCLILFEASLASAQPPLKRMVDADDLGTPIVITKINPQTIGILSKAARVPMGLEALPPTEMPSSIRATARPLRDVLDELVLMDNRYEWREDDGVIVVRPADAWRDDSSLLNRPAGKVTLRGVTATDVLRALPRMFGDNTAYSLGLADTRRFSVDLAEGRPLLSVLDAIVRAHGVITWAIESSNRVSMFVGSFGAGFEVPADEKPKLCGCAGVSIAELNERRRPLLNGVVATGRRSGRNQVALLDRVVGLRYDGQPLVAQAMGSIVRELSMTVGVPIGIELVPPSEPRALPLPVSGARSVTLTGMTLKDALTALVTLDPRYEWRDLNGIIVFRPQKSWSDAAHPLARSVPGIALANGTTAEAIGALMLRLNSPEHAQNLFPDTRRFSLNAPDGTVLDVLNGLARAHGELGWEWESLSSSGREFSGGRRFTVSFWTLSGGGHGFTIP